MLLAQPGAHLVEPRLLARQIGRQAGDHRMCQHLRRPVRAGRGLRTAAAGLAGLRLQRHQLAGELRQARGLDVDPLVAADRQQAMLALEGRQALLRFLQRGTQLARTLVEEVAAAACRIEPQRQAGVDEGLHEGIGDARGLLAAVGGVGDRDHARLLGRPHLQALAHRGGQPGLEVAGAAGLFLPLRPRRTVRAAQAGGGDDRPRHPLALDQVDLHRHVGAGLWRLGATRRHRIGRPGIDQHHGRRGVAGGQQQADREGQSEHGQQDRQREAPARAQGHQETGKRHGGAVSVLRIETHECIQTIGFR